MRIAPLILLMLLIDYQKYSRPGHKFAGLFIPYYCA